MMHQGWPTQAGCPEEPSGDENLKQVNHPLRKILWRCQEQRGGMSRRRCEVVVTGRLGGCQSEASRPSDRPEAHLKCEYTLSGERTSDDNMLFFKIQGLSSRM